MFSELFESTPCELRMRRHLSSCLLMFAELGVRISGPIMFGGAMTIIFFIVDCYFRHILPMRGGYTLFNMFYTSIGLYFLFNVLFNFLMTTFTNPGP